MTSMIERVSKAIHALGPLDLANFRDRELVSRAAIEAMREPTEAMLAAVDCQQVGCCNMADKDACECWQSMIDAALKEQP